MALVGGAARVFGPLAGVVPLVLLFEVLSARFPNHFSILLGLTFLAIVYFAPTGIYDRVAGAWRNATQRGAKPAGEREVRS